MDIDEAIAVDDEDGADDMTPNPFRLLLRDIEAGPNEYSGVCSTGSVADRCCAAPAVPGG